MQKKSLEPLPLKLSKNKPETPWKKKITNQCDVLCLPTKRLFSEGWLEEHKEFSKVLGSLVGLHSPSGVAVPGWAAPVPPAPPVPPASRPQWMGVAEAGMTCHEFGRARGARGHQAPVPMVWWAEPRASRRTPELLICYIILFARTTPGCTQRSSRPRAGAALARRCSPGLRRNLGETRGFCPRDLKSRRLKRKTAFGERRETAAAGAVKSLDKIFSTEKKRALANCWSLPNSGC